MTKAQQFTLKVDPILDELKPNVLIVIAGWDIDAADGSDCLIDATQVIDGDDHKLRDAIYAAMKVDTGLRHAIGHIIEDYLKDSRPEVEVVQEKKTN